MKKRIISMVLVIVLALSLCVPAAATSTTENVAITYRAIKINLNGEEITPCDAAGKTVEPFIMNSNGTTYLPLRAIGQALGLDVAWDSATSTVTLSSGGKVITGAGAPGSTTGTQNVAITYRDIKVVLDGKQLELKNAAGTTVEPFIMGGTTYLPLRVVGEALGLEVGWDSATSTAILIGGEKEPTGKWLMTKETYNCSYYGDMALWNLPSSHSYIYVYDSKGQLLRNTLSSVYGDSVYEWCEEYSYDANGNLISESWDSNDSVAKITYDSEGRTLTSYYWQDYDNSSESATYSYSGNVRYGTHKDVESGVTSNYTSKTVYTYDASGNVVSMVYTDSTGFSSNTYYTYDANGKETSNVYSNSDGFTSSKSQTYDAAGRELTYSFFNSDGESTRYSYTYDANGNELSYEYSNVSVFTDMDGNEQTIRIEQSYNYTYDSAGNMISEVVKDTVDGSTNIITTSYNYDSNGNCISLTTKSNGSDTMENWVYDTNGNCIKKIGRYDVGASGGQNYTYDYEYVYIEG